MSKTYRLEALRPLLPMAREALPLLASHDPFGNGTAPWLIRYIIDEEGFWLQVDDNYLSAGQPFSFREFEGLTGYSTDDLEHSLIDGIGYRLGLLHGRPLLPLPFTAAQLFEFESKAGLIKGHLEMGDESEDWLSDLERSNPDAAALARMILTDAIPPEEAGQDDTKAQAVPVMAEAVEVPAASEMLEQVERDRIEKAIADAAHRETVIEFTPPPFFDPQAAINRQLKKYRKHTIQTARLSEIARLEARDEYEARKQAASPTPATDGTPAGTEPAPGMEAPTSETGKSNTVTHTTKASRRDILKPVIELAQSNCRNPLDTAAVWAQLQVLAHEESAPLLAVTERKIKYMDGDKTCYLSRDALNKRLHPEKRGNPAKRR